MKALTNVKKWTQGVGVEEMIAGVAGLAGAAMLPKYVIPVADTTMRKLAKAGTAVASTVLIGMAAKSVSMSAAKAAVIGGLAGVGAQLIGSFTPYSIGNVGGLLNRPNVRNLNNADFIPSPGTGDGEVVSFIEP
jgi:hypothetical protein